LKKPKVLNKAEDIVESAEDYEGFLSAQYKKWEVKVVRALEHEDIGEKSVGYVEKSFGGFLSRVFNIVNTAGFVNRIKFFVKQPMKEGLDQAEKELDMDIGIRENFDDKADFFVDQQLNGYTLPDGKKWHGIKGASRQMQQKIFDEVKDGVVNKEGREKIAGRVKEVFRKAEEGQAVRIARTETNRFVNSGKLAGYVDSGVKGRKRWVSSQPRVEGSSKICTDMHGQEVALLDVFVDPASGKQFMTPPALPNCKSTIQFVLDEDGVE